jgi:DNA-binding transcriptional ArsR family regulator
MDSRIVLDDKSFRALSAGSRVGILKSLNERRRTLSELSQKLSLGNSTIKEHCDILVDAELIQQIDEGRKWKYYELTQKGKSIIQPSIMDEVKVLIVLSIGVIAAGGIGFFLFSTLSSVGSSSASDTMLKSTSMDAANTPLTSVAKEAVPRVLGETTPILLQAGGVSTQIYVISIIAAVIVGIFLCWAVTRRK